MIKNYNVIGSVNEWLKVNKEKLYDDILDAAEIGAISCQHNITICVIRTVTGVTEYVLKTPIEVIASLRKAEIHFVENEEYENAARARDCIKLWKDADKIYKKKGTI